MLIVRRDDDIYIILHGTVCVPGFHAISNRRIVTTPDCMKSRVTDSTMLYIYIYIIFILSLTDSVLYD